MLSPWCRVCSFGPDGRLRLLAELDGYRYLFCEACGRGLIRLPPDHDQRPDRVEQIGRLCEQANARAAELGLYGS